MLRRNVSLKDMLVDSFVRIFVFDLGQDIKEDEAGPPPPPNELGLEQLYTNMMAPQTIFFLVTLLSLHLSSAWISNANRRTQGIPLLGCSALLSKNGTIKNLHRGGQVLLQSDQRQRSLLSLFLTRNEDVDSRRSTKKSHDEMLRFIESPIGSTVGDKLADTVMDDDLVLQMEKIVKAADGRKADDLVVLAIGHISTLAQALVICSGNSRPQNQAISNAVQEAMEGELEEHILPEGNPNSGWIVLDYGSIMVHVMTPKSRLFYNVEGQWRDKGGKDFQPRLVSEWIQPDRPDADDGSSQSERAEDDPFWS